MGCVFLCNSHVIHTKIAPFLHCRCTAPIHTGLPCKKRTEQHHDTLTHLLAGFFAAVMTSVMLIALSGFKIHLHMPIHRIQPILLLLLSLLLPSRSRSKPCSRKSIRIIHRAPIPFKRHWHGPQILWHKGLLERTYIQHIVGELLTVHSAIRERVHGGCRG